jgi:hypothetical protein
MHDRFPQIMINMAEIKLRYLIAPHATTVNIQIGYSGKRNLQVAGQ